MYCHWFLDHPYNSGSTTVLHVIIHTVYQSQLAICNACKSATKCNGSFSVSHSCDLGVQIDSLRPKTGEGGGGSAVLIHSQIVTTNIGPICQRLIWGWTKVGIHDVVML